MARAQRSPVTIAQGLITDLEQRRETLARTVTTLQTERRQHSLPAFQGEQVASSELARISTEQRAAQEQLFNIDAALESAREALQFAEVQADDERADYEFEKAKAHAENIRKLDAEIDRHWAESHRLLAERERERAALQRTNCLGRAAEQMRSPRRLAGALAASDVGQFVELIRVEPASRHTLAEQDESALRFLRRRDTSSEAAA